MVGVHPREAARQDRVDLGGVEVAIMIGVEPVEHARAVIFGRLPIGRVAVPASVAVPAHHAAARGELFLADPAVMIGIERHQTFARLGGPGLERHAVGAITTTVYDVPPDMTGTITQGGPGLPVSIAVPGQGAAISLAESAGEPFTVMLSNVTVPIMRVTVLNPDGTTLTGPSWALGSTTFALMAPTTGTYTIVLDPYSNYTGNATVGAL